MPYILCDDADKIMAKLNNYDIVLLISNFPEESSKLPYDVCMF